MTAVLWIGVTLAVYLLSRIAYARTRLALLNPALVSIAAIIALLLLTGTPYEQYATGGRWIAFWLGPAVVALGLPLALQLPAIRRNAVGIGLALAAGALTGIAVAVIVAHQLGAAVQVVRSLAPRSATTPIAVAISARLGGIPALSAVVSVVSGAIGAVIGLPLLRLAGVRGPLATGLAIGSAAHGLGTARVAEEGASEAAASGMAMGAVGVLTALLAPAVMIVLAWLSLV